MLPTLLLEETERLCGRDVVWFVDNTAALSGCVKGGSKEPTLAKLVALFWVLCYRLDCRVWLEFVESDANWSDGISRDLDKDEFSKEHGFTTREYTPSLDWLEWDYLTIWRKSKDFGEAAGAE